VIYEWDPDKAHRNLQKHGVAFDGAASVFLDPMALTFADPDHSEEEDREITIGLSGKGRARDRLDSGRWGVASSNANCLRSRVGTTFPLDHNLKGILPCAACQLSSGR
jgi:hypothetical protein